MTFGAEIWAPAAIGAAGSVVGGLLGGAGKANQETKLQRTQRKLVDKLVSSLSGQGPFADLYNTDNDVFQKSFVEPAKALFSNQIAPQIQQQFIASGQQRGTALDDQLLRAGVDLDSMLNQYMYQFNQDSLNRKQGTINSILGAGSGSPNETSIGQDALSSLSGYLASPGFSKAISRPFKKTTADTNQIPDRKGFEPQT